MTVEKFWSKESVALILGMAMGMDVSNIVHSTLGVTDIAIKIAISVVYMYILVTILEWAITTEHIASGNQV